MPEAYGPSPKAEVKSTASESLLIPNLGMFPLILTVLNRDFDRGYYSPY